MLPRRAATSARDAIAALALSSDSDQQSGSPEELYEPSNDSLNDSIKPADQVEQNPTQIESHSELSSSRQSSKLFLFATLTDFIAPQSNSNRTIDTMRPDNDCNVPRSVIDEIGREEDPVVVQQHASDKSTDMDSLVDTADFMQIYREKIENEKRTMKLACEKIERELITKLNEAVARVFRERDEAIARIRQGKECPSGTC